jgi:hypothetical protein
MLDGLLVSARMESNRRRVSLVYAVVSKSNLTVQSEKAARSESEHHEHRQEHQGLV